MPQEELAMTRSFFFPTVLALCLAAPIGCAAPAGDEPDAVAETQDELSSVVRALAGKYYDPSVPFAGIGRLTLDENGEYTAHFEAGGRALCITSPCLIPESGTWTAFATPNGTFRIVLRPTGDAFRQLEARFVTGGLEVKGPGRTTQTLRSLGADGCLDDADCGPSERCGPKVCLMYCAVGDPFCCGPSKCEARPPEPPSCWGAWVDELGTCRSPVDGVYPPECCEGPKCGDTQCAAGEVCCNPLAGICTKPGMACAL
jgi:hypothetical protein